MSLFDKTKPPTMEEMRICPPGTLVGTRVGQCIPRIVLEVERHFGNPNGDNTADHWYWTYLLYDDRGDHLKVQARFFREFVA